MAKHTNKPETASTPADEPPAEAGSTSGDEVYEIDDEAVELIELSEAAQTLVTQLEADRDEALAARQRALADLVNFQRRALDNETRARVDGASGVVRSVLSALDYIDLALGQDREQITVEQLFEGVGIARDELWKALEVHGVTAINPDPGEEFDPNRHQAVFREPTDDHPDGTVVSVLQVGYALGEYVLRAASVSVASAADSGEE